MLNKFNREFNSRRKNMERWYKIVSGLSAFEGLVNNYDGASPKDVKRLKIIHGNLYKSYVLALESLQEVEEIDGFFGQITGKETKLEASNNE